MKILFVLLPLAGACTTLGPMATTTMTSPVPSGSPSLELAAGIAPGYYLSAGTTDDPEGAPLPQASVVFEPDRWIGVPGLFVGGRLVGPSDSGPYGEAMLGYRRDLGERLALGVVGFGTHATGKDRGAEYSATRVGLELAADVRITPVSRWLELHLLAGAGVLGLWAEGSYCLDTEQRHGVDCPDTGTPTTLTDAEASGLYPTGHAGLALAFGEHLAGVFHGGRLAMLAAAGTMPTVVGGEQDDAVVYGSIGLTLSLGFGAAAEPGTSSP